MMTRLLTTITLLLLIAGLQYRLRFGYANFSEITSLETIITQQEIENSKLKLRNSGLIYEVLDLRNGSDALEEYAREEVGMIKKGEIFYQVLTKDD